MSFEKGVPAKNRVDITGKIYGRWTVIESAGSQQVGKDPRNKVSIWLCRCECGTERTVKHSSLKNGYSKSCGCLHKEIASENAKRMHLHKNAFRLPNGEAAFNDLLSRYKRGARTRNVSFNLSSEEFRFMTQQNCHYCNRPPSKINVSSKNTGEYTYNGIDRIDSSLDYEKSNCVTSCFICNRMKLDTPYDEFIKNIERIYLHVLSGDSSEVTECEGTP